MKILIDGRNLALEEGTGVATYARNLSYNLSELGHEVGVLYGLPFGRQADPYLSEIAFFDPHSFPAPHATMERIQNFIHLLRAPLGQRAHEIPLSGRVVSKGLAARLPRFNSLWNASRLFDNAHRYFGLTSRFVNVRLPWRPDIVHWTYPLPIRVDGARNIYTIHDLVPLLLPYTTLDDKRFHLALVKSIARRGDHIVTVSERSKSDIVDLLPVDRERVTNTYQNTRIPDALLSRTVEAVEQEIRGIAGLQYGGYFLYWGAIEPKKNVGRLIESYLAAEVTTPLVIAGPNAWKADQELRLFRQFFRDPTREGEGFGPWPGAALETSELTPGRPSSGRIIRLPYMPFPRLVSLIQGAKAALIPSLYEGFGLPGLEAMLCGTPVLTSKEGASAEIAGDGALLVDPYDTNDIRTAIARLDSDSALRKDLIEKGTARAAAFSAARYQDRLTAMYDKVMATPR